MACQNHAHEVLDFVSKGKIALLPLRSEMPHGGGFSDVIKSENAGRISPTSTT